jgi:mono/diheme cytochrome c family protein
VSERTAATLGAAAALAVAGAFAAASCSSPRRGEPLVGPLPVEEPRIARGRGLYHHFCQPCHPGGEAGLGPALNDKPAPGFLIKTQVRMGLGAMPAFSREAIPPDDLDDLVAYMMALRRHTGP